MNIASLIASLPLLLTAAAAVGHVSVAPGVSHMRVAYVIGRPFVNGHDRYGECVSYAKVADVPSVYGHEPISVGLGCSESVRVSAVMAAIAWVSAHGETDATVVISREHRGHTAVEAALQALRDKGITVPQHRSVTESKAPGASQAGAMLAGAVFALLLLGAVRALSARTTVLAPRRSMPDLARKRSRSAPAIAAYYPVVHPMRHSLDDRWHKQLSRHTAYHVDPVVPCGHADRLCAAGALCKEAGSTRIPSA